MKLLQLNGQSGGGQMLRSALTLSLITGQPFRMTHIRGQRRKPGLQRQHLTCVKAALEICNGSANGAELHSSELIFHPGKTMAGDYHFAIGTAGSTSLLLQTLLPALWLAKGSSTLRLNGGTHNPIAPPFDFIERTYLPLMQTLGASAQLQLLETGFAPAGGGQIECQIAPMKKKFIIAELVTRGELLEKSIHLISRGIKASICERICKEALDAWPDAKLKVDAREAGPGQGLACLCEARYPTHSIITSAFGERGSSAESVARRSCKQMTNYLAHQAFANSHLANQLLLTLALAGGGSFTTMMPDDHFQTNLSIIKTFLSVTATLSPPVKGCLTVTMHS